MDSGERRAQLVGHIGEEVGLGRGGGFGAGERVLQLGEHRCARIALSGPTAPRALDGIDPELIAADQLPRVPESMTLVNERTTNWTIVPCPTPA